MKFWFKVEDADEPLEFHLSLDHIKEFFVDFQYISVDLQLILPETTANPDMAEIHINDGHVIRLPRGVNTEKYLLRGIREHEFINSKSNKRWRISFKNENDKLIQLGDIKAPRALFDFFNLAGEQIRREEIYSDRESFSISDWYDEVEVTLYDDSPWNEVVLSWQEGNMSAVLSKQCQHRPVFKSKRLSEKEFISHLQLGDYEIGFIKAEQFFKVCEIQRRNFFRMTKAETRRGYQNLLSVVFSSANNLVYRFSQQRRSRAKFGYEYYRGTKTLDEALNFQRELTFEFRRTIESGNKLPSRILESREYKRYQVGVPLDQPSLSSIAQQAMKVQSRLFRFGLASRGDLQRLVINTPRRETTHRTPENLLLINFAVSLGHVLEDFLDVYPSNGLIKYAVRSLAFETTRICEIHQLKFQHTAVEATPLRYIFDHRYQKFGEQIDLWKNYSRTLGGQGRKNQNISVHTVEKLWEYFCLEKIVRFFASKGLSIHKKDSSHDAAYGVEVDRLVLVGERGKAEIFYDSLVLPGEEVCYALNSDQSKKRPDFLISSSIDGYEQLGVLDAKFSLSPELWLERGKEIWAKYGLWFLKQKTGAPLNYVHAIFPTLDRSAFESRRLKPNEGSKFGAITDLGWLTLAMEDADDNAIFALEAIFIKTSFAKEHY
ncbi:hypothetical protein N8944_05335 [Pseudomonadales bacterium]|nr:hypothetical protein [Pseudomonadales bacterium]